MEIKLVLLWCVVVIGVVGVCEGGGLRKNFYQKSCPEAEQIVKSITQKRVSERPILSAKLLRLHFHDCFVRGCDGSVLLNSTADNTAEKDAGPNLSLAGFDVIDEIKAEIEAQCPGVVSCADILALAARDAVSSPFNKPMWEVLTGRRDGTVSKNSDAFANLPAPNFNFTQLKQNFASKKLTEHDLVVLSGAHTIGRGRCILFSSRLFNFSGNGDEDPSLNSTYAEILKTQCEGPSDVSTTVEMDPGSSATFDANYYAILLENKGLFNSDASLLTDKSSKVTVTQLVRQDRFFKEFAQSMQRMGAIEVLTDKAGEIRKLCGVVNS